MTPWTNSSVHGILQARILEWVAMPPSREDFNDFSQIKCCLCSKNALTGDIHSLAYSSSVAQSCLTHCDPMDCSMPGFSITNSQSLLKFMSLESVMPSNHLILCHPLVLLPSIFPSIRVFSNELSGDSSHQVAKKKMIFDSVVTIFFRLQRKLEELISCSEVITPSMP